MTTKAQERTALEKIKKIVNDLGEDSYVAMAFEGCFEIAEENIDNDWGCSLMQQVEGNANRADAFLRRAEAAEREVEYLRNQIKTMEADHIAKMQAACDQSERFAKKVIGKELYISLYNHLTDIVDQANARIMSTSEELAAWADAPKDIAVASLLKSIKAEKNRRDDAQQMLSSLEALEPENI